MLNYCLNVQFRTQFLKKKEEYDANYQLLCLILYLSALPIIELFYGTTLQSGGKFKLENMLEYVQC